MKSSGSLAFRDTIRLPLPFLKEVSLEDGNTLRRLSYSTCVSVSVSVSVSIDYALVPLLVQHNYVDSAKGGIYRK